jgi:hypothetical protein
MGYRELLSKKRMSNFEQQLISQYGDPMSQLIASERAKGKEGALRGVNVDKQDVSRLVGLLGNVTPTSGADVLASTENPVYQPNYSDPYGALDSIEKSLGLGTLRDEEAQINAEIAKQKEQAAGIISGIQFDANKTVGLSSGEMERERTLANNSLNTLLDSLNLKQQQIGALESKAQQQFGIYQNELDTKRALMADALQYGDKDVNLNMSIEELTRRGADAKSSYEKEQEKKLQKEQDDAYKKELKDIARSLGISTKTKKGGTMNTKQLEKAIGKANKQALEDAKAWEKEQRNMERTKFNERNLESGEESLTSAEKEQVKKLDSITNDVLSGKLTREQGIAQLADYGFDLNEAATHIYEKAYNGFEQTYYSPEMLAKL